MRCRPSPRRSDRRRTSAAARTPCGSRRCWPRSSRRSAACGSRPCPMGSPILVVPPPISTIGLCPACCSRRSIMICTRLPTWSDGAVGVEADIAGHHLLARQRIEPGGIGELVDVAALVEQAEQGRTVLGHGGLVSKRVPPSMGDGTWKRTGWSPTPTSRRARCARSKRGSLGDRSAVAALRWRIDGPDKLVVPRFAGKGRADELWKTTCFELFLREPARGRYRRAQPLALRALGGLRLHRLSRGHERPPDAARAELHRCVSGRRWRSSMRRCRSPRCPPLPWQVGLNAVLEEQGGRLSYWAIAHPPGKPDFHDSGLLRRAGSGTAAAHEIRHRPPAGGPRTAQPLQGKRVALVAHPASVTEDLTHSLDALIAAGHQRHRRVRPAARAEGRQAGQHGRDRGRDRSASTAFPSSASTERCAVPPGDDVDTADVFLFDLQDLGCRIYTFVTTLLYLLEAAAEHGKAVWVLDRPNPAGRPVEGTLLLPGQESFVGAGPMPMRHGLTLGRDGRVVRRSLQARRRLPGDRDGGLAPRRGARASAGPRAGIWINPSPNAANLNMARAYAGTVMLEGATLSEGRGTTRPLEVLFGAPDIDAKAVLAEMQRFAPDWLGGCALRECWFEPTFHKHAKTLCNGLMIHAEGRFYDHARVPPVAAPGAGVQGDPPALSGLSDLARLPVRVRVRAAGDRRHQRRARLCASGSTTRMPTPSRSRRPGQSGRSAVAARTIAPYALPLNSAAISAVTGAGVSDRARRSSTARHRSVVEHCHARRPAAARRA